MILDEDQLGSNEPSWDEQQPEVLLDVKVLQASAYREARCIARSTKTLAARLERLAPLLVLLQDILSERGRLHRYYKDQKLPRWEDWARTFVAESGIDASWATIKRAMSKYAWQRMGTLRTQKAVPSAKLRMQSICYVALVGLELLHALENNLDFDEALTQLHESGVTKDIILAALKQLGIKQAPEFTKTKTTRSSEFEFRSSLPRWDTSPNTGNFNPGAWSQIADLVDRTVGPEMRNVLNLEDSELQIQCFEKIVSHLARKWIPFNSTFGTMELSIRFVPKPKPKLALRAA
jgi:hypothetical protein